MATVIYPKSEVSFSPEYQHLYRILGIFTWLTLSLSGPFPHLFFLLHDDWTLTPHHQFCFNFHPTYTLTCFTFNSWLLYLHFWGEPSNKRPYRSAN